MSVARFYSRKGRTCVCNSEGEKETQKRSEGTFLFPRLLRLSLKGGGELIIDCRSKRETRTTTDTLLWGKYVESDKAQRNF